MSEKRKPADHDGIPMCSHLVCPRYKQDICTSTGMNPARAADICLPEVIDRSAVCVAAKKLVPRWKAFDKRMGTFGLPLDKDVTALIDAVDNITGEPE